MTEATAGFRQSTQACTGPLPPEFYNCCIFVPAVDFGVCRKEETSMSKRGY
jgi:hypothetical protein